MERWKSERLSYRPYGPEDAAALIDFYSRPETFEFLSANAAIRDAAAVDAFLELVHERHGHYGALPYGYWAATAVIDGAEKVVATAILKPAPDAERKPTEDIEVGWHVHPDFWRQGYAKEMARALLDRGFQRTDRPILHAVINAGNGASRSVARHAGMHHIGSTDRYYGMPFEHYVIDRATWERRALRRTFSVAIFARHEGRILLAKHKRLGTWLPVGGEVESNETPLEAARRELFEETGLEGRFEVRDELEGAPPGLLGYEEHLAGKKGLHLNFCFLCDVPSRDVKLDDSLSAHRWVTVEDGPWDEAPNNVRQLVERALGGGGPR